MRSGDEVLFSGGTVFDGQGFLPPGTSVRVRAGKITEVGPATAAGGAEVIDLDGGTLLPGFIDAHAHPVFAGNQLQHCDLRPATSAAGYLELIAAYAQAHPDEEWITGGGWSMDSFPGGTPDQGAAGRDRRSTARSTCRTGTGTAPGSTSRALELAGITAATPDPADGRIERDAAGQPTGMLQEGATRLVSPGCSRKSPRTTGMQALLAAQQLPALARPHRLAGRDHRQLPWASPTRWAPTCARPAPGTLTATVAGALWWDRNRGLDQLPELLERRRIGQAGRFRATSVKMMLDGVAENHTAAMLEPYLDGDGCDSGHAGLDFIDPAELPGYVTALDAEGFQVHFHALGDRAVRNALDAIEAARSRRAAPGRSGTTWPTCRWSTPTTSRGSRQLSATANIQALWATHEPQMDDLTIPFLGERRSGWQYPFGSLVAAGAPLCAGSDWPVSSPNPLWGTHVAVNRSLPASAGGPGADPFLPGQAISLPVALAAYTSGSARVNGRDDEAGAIRPGLDADFAVVDADLAHLPAAEICLASVRQTWVRGDLAYQQ